MRELRDQQVRFAPREKKLEQVAQAEKLLGELDPERTYTYEYLCFRITNYRPGGLSRPEALGPRGGPRPAAVRRGPVRRGQRAGRRGRRAGADGGGAGQAVQRLDEDDFPLAAAGAGQPAVRDGRPQAGGFPGEFGGPVRGAELGAGPPRQPVQPAEPTQERTAIIRRARRLARAGGCPAEVTRRLARKTGRSPETIRYTLKQFDQDHPDLAIFPDNHGPLRLETKRKIYQQYHRGESVDALARRFCRTRASIYRIIAEMRAAADPRVAVGLHSQRAVRQGPAAAEAWSGRSCGPMPANEEPLKKARLPSRLAPVPGQPLRGAAADPRPGSPPVPQDELPEVQGRQAPRASSTRASPRAA